MYKILFLDTVTTGMNPEACCIYRLGCIYTENGQETKRLDLRMRLYNNARISEQSLWICGESRSSLAVYPSQEEAFKTFIDFLDSVVDVKNPNDKLFIGGFNVATFDIPFLRQWFIRNNNEKFRNYFHMQAIDMMIITNNLLLEKRHQCKDFHLESAARYMGLETLTDNEYDCIQNARTGLRMFRKYREDIYHERFPDNEEEISCIKNY